MTDTAKPSDPHGLIGNNWPPESESSYSDAHTTLTTAATSLDDAASSTSQQASSTRENFHGQTGTSVSDGLDTNQSKLSAAATDLRSKGTAVFEAEQKIKSAKRAISQLTTMGTQQIDATLEAERTGADLPYKKSSSDLISDFQQRISSEKSSLDTDLASTTATLTGQPTSGHSDYSATENENNTHRDATPTGWQRNMQERSGVNFGSQGVPTHPRMPQVSQHTPLDGNQSTASASPGVTPAGLNSPTASPMAATHTASASPLGPSGPAPTASTGRVDTPRTDAPRADSPRSDSPSRDSALPPTLEHLLNPPSGPPDVHHDSPLGGPPSGGGPATPVGDHPEHHLEHEAQPVPLPGVVPVPDALSGVSDLASNALDTAANTASTVGPLAAGAAQIPGQGGLPPTGLTPGVPPSTGLTPGVSVPPPPGLAPVGPSAAPPPVQSTPNPSFAPPAGPSVTPGQAVPGVSTLGPGPGQPPPPSASPAVPPPPPPPSAAPQGTPPHQGGPGSHPTASPGHTSDTPSASPGLLAALGTVGAGHALLSGKTGEDLDAALSALPPEAYGAHCVLASLVSSFAQTGWSGPVAVASLAGGNGQRWFAYVTADGLSVHPNGLALPPDTVPLSQVSGVREAPELLGSPDLHAKLSLLRDAGHIVLTGVSTWVRPDQQVIDPTFHYQEVPVRNRITENGMAAPAVPPAAGIPDVDVLAPVLLNTRNADIPPVDAVAGVLRGLRWEQEQPAGYRDTLIVFLVAQTYAALEEGRYAEASASAEEARRIDFSRRAA